MWPASHSRSSRISVRTTFSPRSILALTSSGVVCLTRAFASLTSFRNPGECFTLLLLSCSGPFFSSPGNDHVLSSGLLAENLFCHLPYRRGAFDHVNARLSHGLHLFGGRPFSPRNDRPGVTHAPSGRRCAPCYEPDDRFLKLPFYIGSGFFFRGAADFSDQNDRVCSVVIVEEFEGVEEPCADNRISPDPDTCGLPHPQLGHLPDRFIGERSAP